MNHKIIILTSEKYNVKLKIDISNLIKNFEGCFGEDFIIVLLKSHFEQLIEEFNGDCNNNYFLEQLLECLYCNPIYQYYIN